MLVINIPAWEDYNYDTSEFIDHSAQRLELEHSLVSLAKWESKHEKVFLNNSDKTAEDMIDYIRCMTLNPIPDPACYYRLTADDMKKIQEYIEAPMTATTFSKWQNKKASRETITAEVMYYWLVALQIPFECQYWHLNRLMTLVKVCNIKNSPKKKMSRSDALAQQRSLNAARRAASGSSG